MSFYAELPIEELSDIVARNPEQVELRLAVVEHFVRRKKLDEALIHARKAEVLCPGNPDVEMWKSMCMIFNGELETGHETLQRLIRNNPCCDFQIRLVTEIVPLFTGQCGDPSSADWLPGISVCTQDVLASEFVDRTQSLLEAVDLLQENQTQGMAALDSHIAQYPEDVNAKLYLAIACCAENDNPKAERLYRQVIALDQECSTAYFDLAAIVTDLEQSVELTKKGLQYCPHASHARYNLGTFLIQTGRFDEARKELRRIPADNSTYTEAMVAIGMSWEEEKDYPRAAECLERAVILNPDRGDIRGKYGQLLCECGWHDKAMTELQFAVELDPNQYCVWANIALLHLQSGHHTQALTSFHKSLELNPQSVDTAINLAVLLSDTGDLEEAIDILEGAVHFHPEDPMICQNLGAFYCNKKEIDRALFYTDRAIELGVDSPAIYWNMANIYCYQDHRDQCLEYLVRAIKLDPGYAIQFQNDDDFSKYWDDPDFRANC